MNDAKSIPEVPTGVLVLTGGVDVGEKMLNYEVVGWAKAGRVGASNTASSMEIPVKRMSGECWTEPVS